MSSQDDAPGACSSGSTRPVEQASAEDEPRRRRGLFRRLADSLQKSRRALGEQIQAIAFDPDDEEAWEQLEEALLLADCGVPATVEIMQRLERRVAAGELKGGDDLGNAIAEVVTDLMRGARGADRRDAPGRR